MLGTPPAFILSQDQTLNKLYPNRLSPVQILLKLTSSQKNFSSLFRLLKNPFLWCLFSISCSYIVQFSRCSLRSPSRRQLCYINTAFRVCQELFSNSFELFSSSLSTPSLAFQVSSLCRITQLVRFVKSFFRFFQIFFKLFLNSAALLSSAQIL